ncbi:MAG: twin-arginine translocase subunit TatC, partial [Thermoplasmata archaeon]
MGDLSKILVILGEVRRRLVRILWVLGPLLGFLLTFQLQPVTLRSGPLRLPFAYPVPNLFGNITSQVFRAMTVWMLPPGVQLLNVGVGDSVVVQLEVGALLTLILGMPWIVHETAAF